MLILFVPALKDLRLDRNNIRDITPISNLVELTYLSVGNNNISNIDVLSNLTKLNTLYLNNNQIKNIEALKNLTNLKVLSLKDNSIKDIGTLSKLTNIEELWLNKNHISNIEPIYNLSKLKTINLEENIIRKTEKNETKEIDLPQIIKDAKNSERIIYTEEDYTVKGCKLSGDGKRIIVDDDSLEEIIITIQGGNAKGTTFIVDFEDETNTAIDDKETTNTKIPVDDTMAKSILPYTGKTVRIALFIVIVSISFVAYIKTRKYKDC